MPLKITIAPVDPFPMTIEYPNGDVHSFHARSLVIEGEDFTMILAPSGPIVQGPVEQEKSDEGPDA